VACTCASHKTVLKDRNRSWGEREWRERRERENKSCINVHKVQGMSSGTKAEDKLFGRCLCRATLASFWQGGLWSLSQAGQLCGTAAIVEQNSFLMTYLSSHFSRKYSSWVFFSLHEVKGNQK
jgi:hypothetical protein